MRTSHHRALSLAAVLLLGSISSPSSAGERPEGERFSPARRNGVPNRYIVVLEDQFGPAARPSGAQGPSVAEVASDIAQLHAATPLRTWELAFPGFLVELPEGAARALSHDPRVRFVEQDSYVELQNVTQDCYQETAAVTDTASFPTSPQRIECTDPQPAGNGCFDNWGLDRIDQRLLSKRADGQSNRDGFYSFDLATPGVTVHAYLLDTGITAGHQDFRNASGSSRILAGVNASVPLLDPQRNNVTDDLGHGTHVAGILGGMTFGASKDVRLHAIKVSRGSTSEVLISNFVEGINWILATRPAGQPAVANLSANGPGFLSLAASLAVTSLVQSGVTFVQSAGNQNQLAANVSMVGPGFPQEVIIAGGMDERDGRWTRSTADPSYSLYCDPTACAASGSKCDCGSNYGTAVDVWAPASHIVSSGRRANNAICWLSGTSMAAPHVAGTAALLLGRFPNASPSAVEKAIKSNGTAGALTDSRITSSERLLYSRFPTTGGPVAGDDRFFTSPGTPIDITFAALLAGDFDWNRDPLSIVSFGTASSGQVQVLSNRVRYTPAAGFTGEATFPYTVTDGRGNNDTALVRVRVENRLLPPVAADDQFTVNPGEAVYMDLLANDSSRNGRTVYIKEIVRRPLNGTVSFDGFLRSWRYAPNPGFRGTDSFVYRISEEETLLEDDATVNLTVGVILTSTPSPAAAYHGFPITWTATASGGTGTGRQYALFRRRVGTTSWFPALTSPAWQTGNVLSWTPSSAEIDTWEISIWVRDSGTPANMNTYGYAASYEPGPVRVVAPPTVTGTGSPASANCGTTITWTATMSGGTGSGRQYALFRRLAGTSSWIPAVSSPAWQSSNVLSWTPSCSELGVWEIIVWARDSATPASMNTYGFAAYYNAQPVQVTVSQAYPPIGWVDGYDRQHIWGWACDPDYPMQSNRVDIYTTSWQYLGTADAYFGSSAPINSACGGGSAHYFDFYHWGSIPPGTHFMVWSIDLPYATPGNDNRPIGGNGSIGNGTEFVIP